MIINTWKRIDKQMDKINYERYWTGFEELPYEELKKVANYQENFFGYIQLIELFISIKEEDMKRAKEILYKYISDEDVEKKKKEKIEKNNRIQKEIQEIYFNKVEEII